MQVDHILETKHQTSYAERFFIPYISDMMEEHNS